MNNDKQLEVTPFELVPPTALESIERANIDIQINTAKRFPRSLALVKNRMLELATLDQETAASCFYKLNRQGNSIEGPSIRLAEIAGSCYGNLRYGSRIIGNDGKQITAQGFCHDLETNVMSMVEVRRRITDRTGRTYSDDMQVVTGNAACSIAARNAIFKVVPFAFVKPIFTAAKKAAVGDIKTLADRRTSMLTKLSALGVNSKRLCATVQVSGIEEIGLDQLETIIGLYNAVIEKEQSVDEAFPIAIARPIIPKLQSTSADETESDNLSGGVESRHATSETDLPVTGTCAQTASERLVKSDQHSGSSAPPAQKTTKLRKKKEPTLVEVGFNEAEMTKRLAIGNYSPEDLIKVATSQGWIDAEQDTLAKIGEEKLGVLLDTDNWQMVMEELDKLQQ